MTCRVGNFDMWIGRGALIRGGERFALYQKPGHAGRGSHHGPKDAQPQTLTTYALAEGADAAEDLWEAYQEIVGDDVDVVDGLERSHAGVRVLAVRPAMASADGPLPWMPAAGMDGTADHVVVVSWLLLLDEDTQT